MSQGQSTKSFKTGSTHGPSETIRAYKPTVKTRLPISQKILYLSDQLEMLKRCFVGIKQNLRSFVSLGHIDNLTRSFGAIGAICCSQPRLLRNGATFRQPNQKTGISYFFLRRRDCLGDAFSIRFPQGK